jgi:hypothetical protein
MPARPQNLKALPRVSSRITKDLDIDASVSWLLANPYGIQAGPLSKTDPLAGTWHSGHANDVRVLPSGSPTLGAILVGTDSGGVWIVYPSNSGVSPISACLTDDWDTPGVVCLCEGPGGPQHFYAGTCDVLNGSITGYVYETVAENGVYSTAKWRAVPNGAGQLTDFVSIYRMLVVSGSPNRLVLATDIGLFWADIPAPGGDYAWQQVTTMADGTAFLPGSYSGLAAGPGQRVVVAAYGVEAANGHYGIFYGDWSTGQLVMTRSSIPPVPASGLATFAQGMYRTSLSACPTNLNEIYAISASSANSIYAILRSQDGGKSWIKPYDPSGSNPAAVPTVLPSGSLFASAALQGGYNQAIAVSSADSTGNTLAIGWESGTYLTKNGGVTWQQLQGAALHSDVHGLYFDPADATGKTLYICSDGGVAVTRDGGVTFDSSFNIYLPTLQFYSTTSLRDFYGTMSLSDALVAAGSQDNGNLYCTMSGTYTGIGTAQKAPSPWVWFRGGDGGPITFLATGQAADCFVGAPLVSQSLESTSMWTIDPGASVLVNDPGQPDNGKALNVGIEAVRSAPKIVNSKKQNMYAVAYGWGTLSVYGLFANSDGSGPSLEHIGSVQTEVANDSISAVGTLDGSIVFVGTSAGRMFKIAVSPGMVASGESLPVALPPGVPQGAVQRIVATSASEAYSTYNFGWQGRLLKFNGTSWTPTDSGLPGDVYQGLECDDTGTNVYAAAADRVYLSSDQGTTWLDCSTGLPQRPHCSDLRFIRESSGVGYLYLSTFGRSVWRARAGGSRVPDLTHVTLPVANQELAVVGLHAQPVISQGPPPGPGVTPAIVVSQNPKPGALVAIGSAVALRLQSQRGPHQ